MRKKNNNILKKEASVLERAKNVIEEGQISDEVFEKEYGILYKEYAKVFRQMKKLISISDKIQNQLQQARSELKAQYDKMDRELAKAARHIFSLLPSPMKNNEIEISWKFVPSTRLAGDVFGYHMLNSDMLAVYIIDVCGHGVGSALHSVSVFNAIRHHSLPETDFSDPGSVLYSLNKYYQMEDHNHLYFTAWYCVLNLKTMQFNYSGGGHPPLIFNMPGKDSFYMKSLNPMIGAMPDIIFKSETTTLEKNTSVYLYTDGAYEIKKPDGKMMRFEEMMDFLIGRMSEENSEIEELYDYVLSLSREKSLNDDFSMVKVRV